MKKLNILYYILCILLIAVTIFKKESLLKSIAPEVVTETNMSAGLNHTLTNELSDLEETKQMDAFIERFMSQWEITGASMAIMKNGKLIYSKGFGYADREKGEKTDVQHIFRIASVSKLITATAIMKLCDDGKLKLSDKVFGEDGILNDSMFLNITDKRVKNITVEHLLRHKAGYSLRSGDPLFTSVDIARKMNVTPPIDLNTMVAYAAASRLRVNPGSSNIYSNLGYVVLSKVVEKASGMLYEAYVQQNLLNPLGCMDMHVGRTYYKDKFPNEVKYYEPSDAEPVQPFDGRDCLEPRRYGGCDLQVMSGAGGWVASPTELMKFIAAIDPQNKTTQNIISPQAIAIMTEKLKDEYPIGWMRVSEDGDWWRTGTLAGSSAMLKRQKDGYTWIFLTNSSSWSGSKFPSKIDAMMKQAINKVKAWPERDMFVKNNTK